jgi:Tol biopolymer transport system component
VFYGGRNNTLASTSASGGDVVQATDRNIALFDENHFSPVFLPDGKHYLLLVRGGPDLQYQVWVGELGSNERRLLLKDVTNAQYAPPRSGGQGQLVYVRDRKLMTQPFDTETLRLAGAAMTLAEGVAVSSGGGTADFTTSANGVLAYRRTEPGKEELAWYDRAGKQTGTLGDRAGNPRNNVRVSPDGKWAAFTRAGDAFQDVWIADLGRGGISRFTFEGGRSPVWSPDGSQLAFLRQDTIYRKSFIGGGAETALWSGPGIMSLNDLSGDGTYLLLTRWDTTKPALTGRGLWLLPDPLGNTGSRDPVLFEPDALHGQFGPKTGPARWVSFDAFDGAIRQVFVRTMPGGPQGKWQISSNGGNTSRWRADGRELFMLGSGSMLAVGIDASASFHASAPRTLFTAPPAFFAAAGQYAHGWDVSPDGRQFLTTLPVPDMPAQAITVVLNWQSTLSK